MQKLQKTELLAEKLRDLLLKPPHNNLGDRIRARQNAEPDQARGALQTVNHAHRYVLEDSFTEAAARFSSSPPELLLKAARFARMPFSAVWIEWNDEVRRAHSLDNTNLQPAAKLNLPRRRGLLLTMKERREDLVIVHVQPVMGDMRRNSPDSIAVLLTDHAFELYFLDEALDYGRAMRHLMLDVENEKLPDTGGRHTTNQIWPLAMGYDYLKQNAELSKDATQDLADLACISSSILYSEAHGVFNDESSYKYLLLQMTMCTGDARFALAVLSLLTDIPETTIRTVDSGKRGSTFRSGKFLPKYEYKMLSITRPATEHVISLGQRVTDYLPWAGVRLHTVEGHWCYSHRHGRTNCPHPDWRRHRDDEGNPLGQDMWQCIACGKYRWWRNAHLRGNPEIGTLDKGFEIKADRDRTGPPL